MIKIDIKLVENLFHLKKLKSNFFHFFIICINLSRDILNQQRLRLLYIQLLNSLKLGLINKNIRNLKFNFHFNILLGQLFNRLLLTFIKLSIIELFPLYRSYNELNQIQLLNYFRNQLLFKHRQRKPPVILIMLL
jgi:hypothetical protein